MSVLRSLARIELRSEENCCHEVNNSTVCPCHDHDHDELEHLLSSVIPVVGFLLIIVVLTIVIIASGCWYYHNRRRRREMAILTEKGELIVLKDDGKRANKQAHPLVIKLSQLELRRHSENNNYSNSSPENVDLTQGYLREIQVETSTSVVRRSSIPLTKDGYAMLEPESCMELGYNSTGFIGLQDDAVNQTDQNVGKMNVISDHHEVSENFKLNKHDHDYEEPYWEPANKEEELMDQLSKLGVPEILTKSIELKEQLGSGQFGMVQHGIWKIRSETGCKDTDVAVKVVENGGNLDERVKFLQEAVIMGQFKNPYILQILGIINEDHLKIVMEIMSKGDLHHHLLSLRQQDGQPECKELGALLLSYTRQIALGLGYLSLKQYIHRDLAARNVLVSENGICKIADFGLSRDLQMETYYVSHGGKIPVKWTAPEALHYRKYSTASDVWSYGCLLYEIWSLGYKPFHDVSNADAIQKISSGYRLPPPPGCSRTIYQIMISCWHPDPSSRHHISDITVALQQPDFQILGWTEEVVAGISEEARLLSSPLEEGHSLYKDLQNTYIQCNTACID